VGKLLYAKRMTQSGLSKMQDKIFVFVDNRREEGINPLRMSTNSLVLYLSYGKTTNFTNTTDEVESIRERFVLIRKFLLTTDVVFPWAFSSGNTNIDDFVRGQIKELEKDFR